MVKVFGKYYYINIDNLVDKCTTAMYFEASEKNEDTVKKTEDKEEVEDLVIDYEYEDAEESSVDANLVTEMNLFKYELLKMIVDRVINDVDESEDDDMGLYSRKLEASFQIAFNTLIKYNILIEDDE